MGQLNQLTGKWGLIGAITRLFEAAKKCPSQSDLKSPNKGHHCWMSISFLSMGVSPPLHRECYFYSYAYPQR